MTNETYNDFVIGDVKDVNCVASSPFSKFLAIGTSDGLIKFIDDKTDLVFTPLNAHQGIVNSLAFADDHFGNVLASGGVDQTVHIFSLINNSWIKVYSNNKLSSAVSTLTFVFSNANNEGMEKENATEYTGLSLVVGCSDGALYLFSLMKNYEWLMTKTIAHQSAVKEIALLKKFYNTSYEMFYYFIVTCSDDITIKVWDISNDFEFKLISVLLDCDRPVLSISVSNDTNELAAQEIDGTIKIWDIGPNPSFDLKSNLPNQAISGHNIVWNADDTKILTSNNGETIKSINVQQIFE